jgi:hypothetical protein
MKLENTEKERKFINPRSSNLQFSNEKYKNTIIQKYNVKKVDINVANLSRNVNNDEVKNYYQLYRLKKKETYEKELQNLILKKQSTSSQVNNLYICSFVGHSI